MGEWLKQLFVKIFGSHSGIATFIISMIPIVELRGAIPFGAATSLWGKNALELWESFLISFAGSSLVCVILAFIFWPLFNWLKKTKGFKKLAGFIERKLNRNSKSIDDKTEKESNEKRVVRLKMIGIFLFVAVPLPLTGVWTGTCLALFIGLNRWQSIVSAISGNLVAGLIMTLISYFFADNTMIVLLVFLALVVLFVLIEVVKSLIQKHKNKKKGNGENLQSETEKSDLKETKNESEEVSDKLTVDESLETETKNTELESSKVSVAGAEEKK